MRSTFILVSIVFLALGCGSDGSNRDASNQTSPTASDVAAHFVHALDALNASSPPVVEDTIVAEAAIECAGHRCCAPTCAIVETAGQACHDHRTSTSYVALTDDPFCVSMFVKLDAAMCASVRCQTTGCLGQFEEAFRSDCARLD